MNFRSLCFAVLLTGCATDTTDEPVRGPLGKADAPGSCSPDDCGGQSAGGTCWCDDLCASFGDCCADKAAVCEPDAPQACGGFSGTSPFGPLPGCGDGDYCQFSEPSDNCGFVTGPAGVCMPIPAACTAVYMPVCGCDGKTYGNECEAHAAGISVRHPVACEDVVVACGEIEVGPLACPPPTVCVEGICVEVP